MTIPAPLLIKASQGLGKTRELLSAVAAEQSCGNILLLVPTLAKADEAKRDYDKLSNIFSMTAYVFRGRGADDPETNEKMCPRHEVAAQIAQAGLSITKALCENCTLRTECQYQKQLKEIRRPSGKFIIAAHEHLFIEGMPVDIDLLVIDESVTIKAASHYEFTPDRIINLKLPDAATEEKKTLRKIYEAFRHA